MMILSADVKKILNPVAKILTHTHTHTHSKCVYLLEYSCLGIAKINFFQDIINLFSMNVSCFYSVSRCEQYKMNKIMLNSKNEEKN